MRIFIFLCFLANQLVSSFQPVCHYVDFMTNLMPILDEVGSKALQLNSDFLNLVQEQNYHQHGFFYNHPQLTDRILNEIVDGLHRGDSVGSKILYDYAQDFHICIDNGEIIKLHNPFNL